MCQTSLPSDIRHKLFQICRGFLEVSRVYYDLYYLQQCQRRLAKQGRQASAEGPCQQEIRRFAYHVVDLFLGEVQVLGKFQAGVNELFHLLVHFRHHVRERKFLGELGFTQFLVVIGKQIENLVVFHLRCHLAHTMINNDYEEKKLQIKWVESKYKYNTHLNR